jgi:hypothetical protein
MVVRFPSRFAIEGILATSYQGKPIAEHPLYREALTQAEIFYREIFLKATELNQRRYRKLIRDPMYVETFQYACESSNIFARNKDKVEPNFLVWFMLAYYQYLFEIACKQIAILTRRADDKELPSCGSARGRLPKKKLAYLFSWFDSDMRNAIDHGTFLIDNQTAMIHSWKYTNEVTIRRSRSFSIGDVWDNTIRLSFFILALRIVFHLKEPDY